MCVHEKATMDDISAGQPLTGLLIFLINRHALARYPDLLGLVFSIRTFFSLYSFFSNLFIFFLFYHICYLCAL